MNKSNLKKYISRCFRLLIGLYIVYSIFVILEYKQHINQRIEQNIRSIWNISTLGINLVKNLQQFMELPVEQENNSDVNHELFTKWRIVTSQSKSIDEQQNKISLLYTGEKAEDWSLLCYSLNRTDSFIRDMTNKFLEQKSFAITSEERERLEAVIVLFQILDEEIDKDEAFDLEFILQSIKEPMKVIDENYEQILKDIGRE